MTEEDYIRICSKLAMSDDDIHDTLRCLDEIQAFVEYVMELKNHLTEMTYCSRNIEYLYHCLKARADEMNDVIIPCTSWACKILYDSERSARTDDGIPFMKMIFIKPPYGEMPALDFVNLLKTGNINTLRIEAFLKKIGE